MSDLHAADRIKAEAMSIFADPPQETSQDVRDVIEWYHAQLRIELARAALSALSAPAVPLGLTIERSFRWDGDARRHIPTLLIEFEPVPAGEPNDAKGWADRDSMAHWLHTIAPSAKETQT